MGTSRTIAKAEWRSFFDTVSNELIGKRVEIEAASLDFGDQIVAEWVPLLGITYDPHDDAVQIALTSLNHVVRRPEEVYVQEGAHGVETIAVQTADGSKRILRLKEPMMLTAGETGAASHR